GEFCQFENVAAFPKPVQTPHPPVLIGGNTKPALRRAAKRGQGWFGWNLSLDELATAMADLRELLAAEGRESDGFVMQVGRQVYGDIGEAADYARACEQLGIERLVLALPFSRRTFSAQLDQ